MNVTRLVPDNTNFGDRAPAIEALIDIRVTGTIDLAALEVLSTELAVEFPIEQPVVQWVGTFELKALEAVPQVEHRGIRGFLRRDRENRSVVQVRRDGFTFSKLEPYTSWTDVCDAARRLWQRYVDVAKPDRISRVAVRYVNHIRPPDGWKAAGDWLRVHATSPAIPGVPSDPADFHVRMLQRHPSADYSATITVATIMLATGKRALLFDIDVGHEGSWAVDDESAWSILADLRDYKNDIFFGTITPQTKELLLDAAHN